MGIAKNRLTALILILLVSALVAGCQETPVAKQKKEAERDGKKEQTGKREQKDSRKKIAVPSSVDQATVPTDLAFGPDGGLYFTEKGGALKVVRGKDAPETILEVAVPRIRGYHETGLLGLALSPSFSKNKFIYLYHTYTKDGGLANRVVRVDTKQTDVPPTVIVDNIPGARIHNGGKIRFGPDGNLFIATGDSGQPELAQRMDSLNGKVLRVKPDGSIASHNPFPNSPIVSLGHRNIFGMAFDAKDNAYVTENGPDKDDEVNRIEQGKNYGWPTVLGPSEDPRFTNPLLVYASVIAPTGIVYYDADLIPQLKGQLVLGDYLNGGIHAVILTDSQATSRIVHDLEDRINALALAPDGALYAATQDKIVRIDRLP